MSWSAVAQQGLGPGRRPPAPDICMSEAELEAEAILRTGIVLRAYARECARRGHDGSILPAWGAFDGANAENLRAAVQLRNDAYARNYPDSPKAGQKVVDEVLTSRQLVTLSAEECAATAEVVRGLATWDDFLIHVRRTELGKVRSAIRTCPPRPR